MTPQGTIYLDEEWAAEVGYDEEEPADGPSPMPAPPTPADWQVPKGMVLVPEALVWAVALGAIVWGSLAVIMLGLMAGWW